MMDQLYDMAVSDSIFLNNLYETIKNDQDTPSIFIITSIINACNVIKNMHNKKIINRPKIIEMVNDILDMDITLNELQTKYRNDIVREKNPIMCAYLTHSLHNE